MDPHWRRTRIALLKQSVMPLALVALAGVYLIPRYGDTWLSGPVDAWKFTAALPLAVFALVATYRAERGLVGRTANAGNRGGATTGPWLGIATTLATVAAVLVGLGLLDVAQAWR